MVSGRFPCRLRTVLFSTLSEAANDIMLLVVGDPFGLKLCIRAMDRTLPLGISHSSGNAAWTGYSQSPGRCPAAGLFRCYVVPYPRFAAEFGQAQAQHLVKFFNRAPAPVLVFGQYAASGIHHFLRL